MSNTRYRRGKLYAADMAVYTRQMAADNSAELSRLKRNLIRALKEDVTPRQREVLTLYYAQGLNMREIGERLGVDKSTVSRTIKRGEARLRRCLRYGAGTGSDREKKTRLYATVQDFAKAFAAQHGSYICRELLALGPGPDSPVPEARTDAYYSRRPCAKYVRAAAELLERYL